MNISAKSSSFWQHTWVRYGVAIAVTLLAALLRWILPDVLAGAPYLVFYAAVVVASVLGGVGPGMIAVVGSLLLVNSVFTQHDVSSYGLHMRNLIWIAAASGVSFLAGTMRKAREKAEGEALSLQRSEERFRALATASSDVLYRMSPDWTQMRFLESKEFIADTLEPSVTWVQKHIHPDDQAHVMSAIQEAIRTKGVFELEYRVLRVDGSLGWTFSRAVPLTDAKGDVVEWFGAARDVTKRKQAEDAAHRLAAIVEFSDEAIIGKTLDGTITSWNRGAQALYGYSEAEVMGRHISILLPEWQDNEMPELLDRLARGEAIQPYETWRRRKDGRELPVLLKISPIEGANGAITGASSIAIDITESKQAEQERQASQERLRLANEVARIGSFEWNLQNQVAVWSPELEALYGLAPGSYSGKYEQWVSLIHPEDLPQAERKIRQALETGTFDAEYRAVWPDGTVRWLVARGQVFKDESGRPERMVGVNLDITERKRGEEALVAVMSAQHEIAIADLDYAGLRQFILERMALLLAADGASLEVIEGDEMVYEAATGIASGFVGLRLKKAGSMSGLSMTSNQMLRADDTDNDPRVDRAACRRIGLRSMIMMPLRYGEDSFGVLKLMSARIAAFDDDAQHRLQLMGEFLGVTVARKRAEDALRQSLERLEKVLDVETVGVMFWDLNTGFMIDANDTFLRTMGYTRSDVDERRLNWQTLTPSEYIDVSRREVEKFLATGRVGPYEKEYFRKDGSRQWLLFAGSSLGGNQCVEFCVDISDRKKAEAALRESEKSLTRAQEIAHLGSWELDLGTNRLTWSDEVYRIFGLQPQEFAATYEAFLERVHPDDRARVDGAYRSSLSENRDIYEIEHRVVRKDTGEVRVVHEKCEHFRDATGTIIRSAGMVHDITSRKQAEEALRTSEERWATTLQSIGDAVISTDAAGSIVFMNEVAQKLSGWSSEEAKGKDLSTVFNIVQEETHIRPENPVAKVLRLGKVVGLANHTVLIRRDGIEIPIEDSAAPIRNRESEIEGVVLVFHDVSEQKIMQKVLRDTDRLATTGRLAATIAHEIHNPLDVIGNVLHLIGMSTQEEETREYAMTASEELERLTQITQQMLTFQRESTTPVPVQIRDVLDNIIALHHRKIASAGIKVECAIDSPDPIQARPGELRQVFANLVGNAIEAVGGDHGRIKLHAYAARNWRTGQLGMRVVVADNGKGIPRAVRGKVFEPFFTTKGESGTGLGLWISAGIVSKYDGTLRLRSTTRAGRSGTCFSVFFPYAEAAQTAT